MCFPRLLGRHCVDTPSRLACLVCLSVSLLACGVSVCCLGLCSHHTSRASHHFFGEPNFYHVRHGAARSVESQDTLGFSSQSFNTRTTPGKYLPTMISPLIGQSLELPGKPISSRISVWAQFASSSTPFPSLPFANNAVVWTHRTRSSKPPYIWCICCIRSDRIRQYLYCRYRCRSRLQRYSRSIDGTLGTRSYGVGFQLTKLMETSSQWSIMASRSGMMVVSSYYMAQYRFSIGTRSGRQAQSDRLWDRCILQLDPNRS